MIEELIDLEAIYNESGPGDFLHVIAGDEPKGSRKRLCGYTGPRSHKCHVNQPFEGQLRCPTCGKQTCPDCLFIWKQRRGRI